MSAAPEPHCSMCKDLGYVSLPGLQATAVNAALLEASPRLAEAVAAGWVETLYRCEFCDAADAEGE